MEDPIIWQIVLQIFLIALNAVFACAEIAVISMNDNKLAQLAAQGDKRAVKLAKLTSRPARFLATIQVAITLSGFMGSAFAADNFSDKLVSWLMDIGTPIPAATLDTVSVILITLVLSYFTLVFGELVPKRIAMKKAESLALAMASMISFIAALFSPVVWVLTASNNLILRLFGIDPDGEDEKVSEEEIRMMVDAGSEKGVIDPEEKEMIQNVFEFDDLTVGEFATHRTDISMLPMDETLDQWEKTIHEDRHTLYPVCGRSVDHIVGILNIKDYFRLHGASHDKIMAEAVKPASFVPESVRADVLFRQMKQSKNHFAVVLDEYGGTAGIVTMNDLLEQLVGDLDDDISSDGQAAEIEQLDPLTWRIKGCAPLNDVIKQLKVNLPAEEYDTFGGLVFSSYGFVPGDGSEFEIDIAGLHINVTEIKEHRIETALVYLASPAVNPAGD